MEGLAPRSPATSSLPDCNGANSCRLILRNKRGYRPLLVLRRGFFNKRRSTAIVYRPIVDISYQDLDKELGANKETNYKPELKESILELIIEGQSLINPIADYKLVRDWQLQGAKFKLPSSQIRFRSNDLAKLMANQQLIVFLAVTIGQQLEKRVEDLFAAEKLTKATILDSIGSTAVEKAANEVTKFIAKQAQKKGLPYLTKRFSPGYGDLDLATQPKLLKVVNGSKLGITANSSYLLQPRKSITALLGLGTEPSREPGCDFDCKNCNYEECIYA